MAATLYYSPFIPAFNSNGAPVPGAQLLFYLSGTTTKTPPYSDAGLTIQLANPVPADAAGRFPPIYLSSLITYRVRILDASGVQIGVDADPYLPASIGAVGFTGAPGTQGPQGIPGTAAAQGTAATITVGTVSTLAAGASATVINVGTTTAAVFNIGIPQGAAGSGSGSVTSASVVTANGVSGSVTNPTTTPAITLTLGAITPSSVAASGAVTGSNLSGTNTGDQNLSTYALLASPALTGAPTAPTASAATNSTQIATTAFVQGTTRPTFPGNPSASFTAADADNNTHKVASGASQTLTLGSITAGTAFTLRFTTAWSIACAGGLSKNGAAPGAVTTGTIAIGSLITFLHEGAGVWLATGTGLS